MSAPLELTGLTKVFDTPSGAFVAVKDVNAAVHVGEFVAVLGHSGCGKSTVLSMIAGLDRATYGGVVIDGKQVVGPGAERAIVFRRHASCRGSPRARQRPARAAQRPGTNASQQRASADRYLELVGIADAGGPAARSSCRSGRSSACRWRERCRSSRASCSSTSRSRSSTR